MRKHYYKKLFIHAVNRLSLWKFTFEIDGKFSKKNFMKILTQIIPPTFPGNPSLIACNNKAVKIPSLFIDVTKHCHRV